MPTSVRREDDKKTRIQLRGFEGHFEHAVSRVLSVGPDRLVPRMGLRGGIPGFLLGEMGSFVNF